MHFGVYGRKSLYTGKGESVENQIEMCKQYIFSKFPDTVEQDITIYEDEGFSAKNTNRPQFQQMLKDIRQKKFDYIVCYRLDRISRNVSDFSALIEDLNDRQISFICIKEEFDTSKPMGKAMMYIASVFAQLERETLAERVRDNMLMLARTGRWLGGTTPTGYSSEKVQEVVLDGKIKVAFQLKDNPQELKVVQLIYEKFLEYNSISAVSKLLIQLGIVSRSGKMYSLLGIKDILQNPVYCIADKDAYDFFAAHKADVAFEKHECSHTCGILSYNKRDYKKKHAPRQSIDKWIIAKGKHKGLVSGKEWVMVQEILVGKKPESQHIHNDYSLMSGMIYCKQCSSKMFAKRRTHDMFDYICQNKIRGGTNLCNCQNINGQQADDMVLQYIKQFLQDETGVVGYLTELMHNWQKFSQPEPAEFVNLQINKYQEEIDNLISTLSQPNLDALFIRRVNQRVSELDKAISDLQAEKIHLQLLDTEDKSVLSVGALSDIDTCFQDLSICEKRILLQVLIDKIVWDGMNLHVYIK